MFVVGKGEGKEFFPFQIGHVEINNEANWANASWKNATSVLFWFILFAW